MLSYKTSHASSSEFGDNRPELQPYCEPANFDHGAEFSDEPPRSMPAFVRRSRYACARRTTVWSLALVAGACWATHRMSFVQTLSWYLLPLGYLDWIGSGLAVVAVIYFFRNVTTRGLTDFIRSGKPLTGRVRQVGVTIEGTDQARQGRFIAEVEFRNPETSEIQSLTVSAPETFSLAIAPKMDAGVVPGDYVTLTYLPDQLDTSMQMYGWLGLNPDHDLIRKNGSPLKPMTPMAVFMIVLAVMAIGWGLLAFLYIFGRYTPHNDQHWLPYAIGIGIAAIPFMVLMIRSVKPNDEKRSTKFKSYCFAVFLGIVCGIMVGFPAVGFINGFFDRSPGQLEPVKVVQLWHQTINFVVRTYELEYQPFPAGKTEKKMVTVETMSLFEPNSLGVIEVGTGILGIQWLRDFHPIVWDKVASGENESAPGSIDFQLPDEPQVIRIAPLVSMGDQPPQSPPAVMLPELRSRMLANLSTVNARIIETNKP